MKLYADIRGSQGMNPSDWSPELGSGATIDMPLTCLNNYRMDRYERFTAVTLVIPLLFLSLQNISYGLWYLPN